MPDGRIVDGRSELEVGKEPYWYLSADGDDYVRGLFDRHYSRRRYRHKQPRRFIGPGAYILLRTFACDAAFIWKKFRDRCEGQTGVNCMFFRNESQIQSSTLISQADAIADAVWPGERHYTYVNAKKIKSTNPGYCFLKAGWTRRGATQGGLIILDRPGG